MAPVVIYKFVNPPTTPLMWIRWVESDTPQSLPRYLNTWIPIEEISQNIIKVAQAKGTKFIVIDGFCKYADEKKCIFIFISQIDRTFDQQHDQQPGLSDVKLPNPLDLGLFNKSIFVQERSP